MFVNRPPPPRTRAPIAALGHEMGGGGMSWERPGRGSHRAGPVGAEHLRGSLVSGCRTSESPPRNTVLNLQLNWNVPFWAGRALGSR